MRYDIYSDLCRLHLVLQFVHEESHGCGEYDLADHSEQADHPDGSVGQSQGAEVVDHHTKPAAQHALREGGH